MSERVNEYLVGTKEAAALFGVRPSNFVRDWANRDDFPKPVATLARGRLWAREDVETYRARTGPRRAVALADLPLSPDAARWLPVIKRRIVRRFRPDRIVLFGSQVRGDARLDSDADLLVVIPGNAHRRHTEAAIIINLTLHRVFVVQVKGQNALAGVGVRPVKNMEITLFLISLGDLNLRQPDIRLRHLAGKNCCLTQC